METTETRHLDRLGQCGEFEQESNTDSEQGRNTDSHSERREAQARTGGATTHNNEKALQSKEQSTQQTNPSATKLKHRPDKVAGLYTPQTLPNIAQGSSARATPLAPWVSQHEASHRGLYPAVVLVEDSAQLLQHTIDEPPLEERAQTGLAGCVSRRAD